MEFPRSNLNIGGPKKLITGYLVYADERKEELKKEPTNMTAQEIISKLGEEWKNMTEEEKRPYNEKAEANRKARLAERLNQKK